MNELCAARVHSKVPRVRARQPHSIPGAELSDVLIPGFSQLNPDRTLIVDHGVLLMFINPLPVHSYDAMLAIARAGSVDSHLLLLILHTKVSLYDRPNHRTFAASGRCTAVEHDTSEGCTDEAVD